MMIAARATDRDEPNGPFDPAFRAVNPVAVHRPFGPLGRYRVDGPDGDPNSRLPPLPLPPFLAAIKPILTDSRIIPRHHDPAMSRSPQSGGP